MTINTTANQVVTHWGKMRVFAVAVADGAHVGLTSGDTLFPPGSLRSVELLHSYRQYQEPGKTEGGAALCVAPLGI